VTCSICLASWEAKQAVRRGYSFEDPSGGPRGGPEVVEFLGNEDQVLVK
jgi:hypothetical protein